MTSSPFIRRIAAAAVGLALALPLVSVGQANASAWPNDTWEIYDAKRAGASGGGVIWSNRSAKLKGYVNDFGGENSTTVYFTAYAGGKKVAGLTRTAPPGRKIPFDPSIGDPELVGGFDRLSIQVCQPQSLSDTCSPGINLHRNAVAERRVWP